ncbi:MAG: rod shape-determining protein MreC [Anaerolineaceae bacterium]|nr:rod shape-determining protein MreC [Anaerolineaceae bacterium]
MKIPELRPWQIAVILLVFIGLVVLSLSGYLGTILSTASNPLVELQSWISTRYISLYEFFTVPRDLMTLRQQNAQLQSEKAMLQKEVIELRAQLEEAEVFYALLDFARTRSENQYIAASVIGKDPSPFMSYIILDHGSDDGIYHGMPVVTELGLVGRVDAVTANASRVQLVTDPAFTVNVKTQNSHAEGVLVGSITGDIELQMVAQTDVLDSGDLILTSGLGGNYPSELLIGQVGSVRKQENAVFQSASVQPSVDFQNLDVVLIIRNFTPVEIGPLIPTQPAE